MTYTIVPYQAEHLGELQLQRQQAWFQRVLERPEYAQSLVNPGFSFTGLLDGRPIACAGLLDREYGGMARLVDGCEQMLTGWALISEQVPIRQWPRCVKMARDVMKRAENAGCRRIEIQVVAGFVNGAKLAELLGFTFEGTMRNWGPTAVDHWLYARCPAPSEGGA